MVSRRDVLRGSLVSAVSVAAGAALGRSVGAAESAGAPKPGDDPRKTLALLDREAEARRVFQGHAHAIYTRHYAQTREQVEALKSRYTSAVFGRVRVWDLVQKLALCVDPTDMALYTTNQLIHVHQMVVQMERDGVTDPEMILAAIVHDLGKVLHLVHEAPENVFCANTPIGEHAPGIGLDRTLFQWNHDEFGYSRLVDHLPDHLAWLVRYHSIVYERCEALMDARDRDYYERYLVPFHRYDSHTKSTFHVPPVDTLDRYRDLVEETFPQPIAI